MGAAWDLKQSLDHVVAVAEQHVQQQQQYVESASVCNEYLMKHSVEQQYIEATSTL